ncbi:MAG: hypothetical protein AAB727_03135 [Patescibacteria group bacterium]
MMKEIDTSPLARRSIADYDFLNTREWLLKIREVFGRSIVPAHELIYLLRVGMRVSNGNKEERREKLFLYLSIVAGANVPPSNKNTYWEMRRLIDAEAWRVLSQEFFGFPLDAEECICRCVENGDSDLKIAILRLQVQNFFDLLCEREILREIFKIVDPVAGARYKTAKKFPSWTLGGVGPDGKQKVLFFYGWLMKKIWEADSPRRDRDMVRWARRKIFTWCLAFDEQGFLRFLEESGIPPAEPWMHRPVQVKIRQLSIQSRRKTKFRTGLKPKKLVRRLKLPVRQFLGQNRMLPMVLTFSRVRRNVIRII